MLRGSLKMHQIWCILARRAKSISWRVKVNLARKVIIELLDFKRQSRTGKSCFNGTGADSGNESLIEMKVSPFVFSCL